MLPSLSNLPKFIFSLLALFALNACVSADYSKLNNYKTSLKVSSSSLNTQLKDNNSIYIYLVKVKENEIILATIKRPLEELDKQKLIKFNPADRELLKLKLALKALLKGPTDKELKSKLGSEIPIGTRLVSVQRENEKLIINLSEQFTYGGGASSIITRYKQLMKTLQANLNSPKNAKNIYLNIEGKPLERIGGEGLIISNPMNFDLDKV